MLQRTRRIAYSTLVACSAFMAGAVNAADSEPVRILSAYFGLDDQLIGPPRIGLKRCSKDDRIDGMPLVISHEINPTTLDPRDFVVVTALGERHIPNCAQLEPAADDNENRTILLLGELGDSESDPPRYVEIVGEVLTEPNGGGPAKSLRGLQSPDVIQLQEGPRLAWAGVIAESRATFSDSPGEMDCPRNRTAQVLRATWTGGVTQHLPDGSAWPQGDRAWPGSGDELGEAEYARFHVMVRDAAGDVRVVHPFYIGDRWDGDNNNDLCLAIDATPILIEVLIGTVTDPGNHWNPHTVIVVSPR